MPDEMPTAASPAASSPTTIPAIWSDANELIGEINESLQIIVGAVGLIQLDRDRRDTVSIGLHQLWLSEGCRRCRAAIDQLEAAGR